LHNFEQQLSFHRPQWHVERIFVNEVWMDLRNQPPIRTMRLTLRLIRPNVIGPQRYVANNVATISMFDESIETERYKNDTANDQQTRSIYTYNKL
jgi:hypothetical protein